MLGMEALVGKTNAFAAAGWHQESTELFQIQTTIKELKQRILLSAIPPGSNRMSLKRKSQQFLFNLLAYYS